MKQLINTVPAEDQMILSSEVNFLGRATAPLKILIVGNSITRHGPKADIGWNFDWGMAASAPEKDYVHRLYSLLSESGRAVYMRIRQAAYWERHFTDADCLARYDEERDFEADFVIFRLGENVKEEDVPLLRDAILRFMAHICPKGHGVLTTCFWKKPEKDTAIAEAATALGLDCLDIAYTEEDMMAIGQFEHHGVSIHPSDKGMDMIAHKLFDYLSRHMSQG